MSEYSKECLQTFLEKQSQLFDEPVARSEAEAREFLEDCFAVVVKNISEVRAFLEEGMDVDDLSDQELKSASEVFELPNGQYLIVEG